MNSIEIHERDHAGFLAGGHDFIHSRARSTIWCKWFMGGAIFDEFDRPEHAKSTDFTDNFVLCF